MSFGVKCNYCGNIINVNDFFYSDFKLKESDERGIGSDNAHEAYKVVSCGKCQNEINVIVRIIEYPIECFQNPYFDIEGGVFMNKPFWGWCIEELMTKSLFIT